MPVLLHMNNTAVGTRDRLAAANTYRLNLHTGACFYGHMISRHTTHLAARPTAMSEGQESSFYFHNTHDAILRTLHGVDENNIPTS